MEKEQIDYYGMIVIHGTLYEFDKADERLSAYDYKNTYAYPDLLDWPSGFVTGYYDPVSIKLYPYEHYCLLNEQVQADLQYFKIPEEIMVDELRELLTEQQIQKFNEESLSNNHGFYFVDDALNKRLKGELPEIQFDGITYLADLANLRISQKENPEMKFELTHWDSYHNADFFYNPRTKIPVWIDPRISELPKDMVVIRLHNFEHIDPVGFAMYMKQPPTTLVTQKAWHQPKFKAEVIPLHQTKIPELIRWNQMEQEKFKTKKTDTEQPQRRRGKRIH
jgi:hypothetical protein